MLLNCCYYGVHWEQDLTLVTCWEKKSSLELHVLHGMKWWINLLFGTFSQGYFWSLATHLGKIIVFVKSTDGKKFPSIWNSEDLRYRQVLHCPNFTMWGVMYFFKSLWKQTAKTCMTYTDIYRDYDIHTVIHNNKDLIMQKTWLSPCTYWICWNSNRCNKPQQTIAVFWMQIRDWLSIICIQNTAHFKDFRDCA